MAVQSVKGWDQLLKEHGAEVLAERNRREIEWAIRNVKRSELDEWFSVSRLQQKLVHQKDNAIVEYVMGKRRWADGFEANVFDRPDDTRT